jgi:hypothetical protein
MVGSFHRLPPVALRQNAWVTPATKLPSKPCAAREILRSLLNELN